MSHRRPKDNVARILNAPIALKVYVTDKIGQNLHMPPFQISFPAPVELARQVAEPLTMRSGNDFV